MAEPNSQPKETKALSFPSYETLTSSKDGATGGGRGIHPRVTFMSYEWQSAKPSLDNTKNINAQGATSSTTLFVPHDFAEQLGARWGYEDTVTALIDPTNEKAWGASTGETLQNLTKGGFSGVQSAARFGFGKTAFPGEFLIFQQGEPTTLNFTFDLLPMNSGEAGTIVSIIQNFKRRLLPSFGGNQTFFLKFPDIWMIEVKGLNGVGFPDTPTRYLDMALVSCNVTYSGGGNSVLAFHDGNPVAAKLSLVFKSVKHSYVKG